MSPPGSETVRGVLVEHDLDAAHCSAAASMQQVGLDQAEEGSKKPKVRMINVLTVLALLATSRLSCRLDSCS